MALFVSLVAFKPVVASMAFVSLVEFLPFLALGAFVASVAFKTKRKW
jgi:hypothetical protein